MSGATPLLEVRDLEVAYEGAILGLKGLSLRWIMARWFPARRQWRRENDRVARDLRPVGVHQGRVTAGDIRFEGQSIAGQRPPRRYAVVSPR